MNTKLNVVTGKQAQDWLLQAVHRDRRPASEKRAQAFLMCTEDKKNGVIEWTGPEGCRTIITPAHMATWPKRHIRYGLDVSSGVLAVLLSTSKTLMVYRMDCMDERNDGLSPEVAHEIGREIMEMLGEGGILMPQLNTFKRWISIRPEQGSDPEAWPQPRRAVYALVEWSTYNEDDVPFVVQTVLDRETDPWTWLLENGDVLQQSMFVVAWRYVEEDLDHE